MEQTKTTREEEEKRGRYEKTNCRSPLGGVVGSGSGRCISNDAP